MKKIILLFMLVFVSLASPVMADEACDTIMDNTWTVVINGFKWQVTDCNLLYGPGWHGTCELTAQGLMSDFYYGMEVDATCNALDDITIADVPCVFATDRLICYGVTRSQLEAMHCYKMAGKEYCFPEDQSLIILGN